MIKIAKVETCFKSPGPQPNGLQAAPDGLWIIDQVDLKIYKVDWDTGDVLFEAQTDTEHSSGITIGGGYVWIASTFELQIAKLDIKTGKTIAKYDSPGVGVASWREGMEGASETGAHGLEWRDNKLWIAVPPSATIYQVDVEDGFKVIHTLPAPGIRPHGIAWIGDDLWCVETNHRAIFHLDPKDGNHLNKIEIPEPHPEPHGMTYWDGYFWYCDAHTTEVCRVAFP